MGLRHLVGFLVLSIVIGVVWATAFANPPRLAPTVPIAPKIPLAPGVSDSRENLVAVYSGTENAENTTYFVVRSSMERLQDETIRLEVTQRFENEMIHTTHSVWVSCEKTRLNLLKSSFYEDGAVRKVSHGHSGWYTPPKDDPLRSVLNYVCYGTIKEKL